MASLAGVYPVANPARPPVAPHDHVVQFYDDDEFLARTVANFVGEGIANGQPVVIIATEEHREAFCRQLVNRGVDLHSAISSKRLVLLDARETLRSFLVDGRPEWTSFRARIGGLIESVRRGPGDMVRAYGEMVDLLWRDGKPQEAILLEEFWNDLRNTHSFTLLCAYVMGNFYKQSDAEDFHKVCGLHSRAIPTESYHEDADADARLLEVALLQQHARALEHEIEHREELEQELRRALAERRRAEEALGASRQELIEFFENAVEGIHQVGPDGTILWANRAELDLLGYTEEEYVGHNIVEFHADRGAIEDMLASSVLRNGKVVFRASWGTGLSRTPALQRFPTDTPQQIGAVRGTRAADSLRRSA